MKRGESLLGASPFFILSYFIDFFMKTIFKLSTFVLLAASATAISRAAASDYKLVWSDEFDGTTLNTKVWNVESNGNGGGNNELQYYLPGNVKVTGGNLVITAKKQSYGSKSFTSGRINSMGKVAFKHGKVEARIKLPKTANGLWPAFWLMGNDMADGVNWPYCGEIDVLEAGLAKGIETATQDKFFNAAMHWGPYTNGNHPMYSQSTTNYTIEDGNYHIYTMVWDDDAVSMYVDLDKHPDETPYFKMNINDTAQVNSAGRYFHKRFFLLFNLAVGGSATGIYDASGVTALNSGNQEMAVDYVRVYQREDSQNYITPDGEAGNDKPSTVDNVTSLGAYGSISLNDDGTSTFDFAHSKDYVLIGVSDGVKAQMQGNIKADYNVDNVNNFLYIWENTYNAGTSTGNNSFGYQESYPVFTVANVGWSGLGYASTGKGKDLSMIDDSYILHFAMRGTDNLVHTSHAVIVGNAKFTIGSTAFVDNGSAAPVLGDFKRDGRWCSFDIPVSVLKSLSGKLFTDSSSYLGNVFAFLSGGSAGAQLQFDNVFFYRNDSVNTSLPTTDTTTVIGKYASKALDAAGATTFDFDDGYDYVLIGTSTGVTDAMTGKIKANYNVDDTDNFLWIWEKTYNALTSTGVNSFGFQEAYQSFTVGTVGWSGMGFASTGHKGKDLSMLDNSYYLHFAMKGNDIVRHACHTVGVGAAQFVIGNSSTGTTVLGDYKRDGEWYYFDIPYRVIKSLYGDPFTADGGVKAYTGNVVSFLSGGAQGAQLQFDNIFFYKKHSDDGKVDTTDNVLGRYGSKSLDRDGKPTFDLSKGKDYVLIYLGDAEATQIKDATVADYRPDDTSNFLYVWENTYNAATATGVNSFGNDEPYLAFTVGTAGWSGLSFASQGTGKDLSMLDNDYYLHLAFKAADSTTHATHAVGVGNAHFSLGATAFNDNGTVYSLLGDFYRDGEWYNFDIPFSEIASRANPVFPGSTSYLGNVVSLLSGGVSGTPLNFDAVFFYKKASQSLVGDVDADGDVDVSDVTALVGVILGTETHDNTDINGDGKVNVSDIDVIINIILNNNK